MRCVVVSLAGVQKGNVYAFLSSKVFLYSQCVGQCLSPATLTTFLVSYMTWLKMHTNRHTSTCNKEPGHCFVYMSVADSPRSLDGLRVTVIVSQDPHRQPWEKKLILTPHIPRWMAGGHAVMRKKGWKRGNRPKAYCEDGKISTSATTAIQTGRLQHTPKCIHTHMAEKATQTDNSVTNDYPPATLTWRDWGHMNAYVALSDV